ncbi:MAG: hypothetical protein ACLFQY_10045 [Desulfococcaceae bacterium]
MVNTEKEPGEAYSADEVRRMTVDQPFLLSGEYFRERDQEPKVVLDEMLGEKDRPAAESAAKAPAGGTASKPRPVKKPAADAPGSRQAEKSMAAAEEPRPDIPPAKAAAPLKVSDRQAGAPGPEEGASGEFGLPVKVGVVVDGQGMAAGVPERISESVSVGVRGLPVVIADQDKVREVMTRAQCSNARDLLCLSRALGLYPGVRMLVLVESADLPDRIPGTVTVRMAVVDTGLLFRYPMMEAAVPVDSAAAVDTALAGAVQRALAFAVDKSQVMPWFCRAFAFEDQTWFITAGGRTGLKPGDQLRVLSPGKVVKSPTGMPAGWLPGEPKGRIRVDQLFGADFAACSLVDGAGPGPEDLLVTAR